MNGEIGHCLTPRQTLTNDIPSFFVFVDYGIEPSIRVALISSWALLKEFCKSPFLFTHSTFSLLFLSPLYLLLCIIIYSICTTICTSFLLSPPPFIICLLCFHRWSLMQGKGMIVVNNYLLMQKISSHAICIKKMALFKLSVNCSDLINLCIVFKGINYVICIL